MSTKLLTAASVGLLATLAPALALAQMGLANLVLVWGAQAFGMAPHTLSAAKALSSAYLPISAVVVPEFLYEPMVAASGEVGFWHEPSR